MHVRSSLAGLHHSPTGGFIASSQQQQQQKSSPDTKLPQNNAGHLKSQSPLPCSSATDKTTITGNTVTPTKCLSSETGDFNDDTTTTNVENHYLYKEIKIEPLSSVQIDSADV